MRHVSPEIDNPSDPRSDTRKSSVTQPRSDAYRGGVLTKNLCVSTAEIKTRDVMKARVPFPGASTNLVAGSIILSQGQNKREARSMIGNLLLLGNDRRYIYTVPDGVFHA